MLCMPFGVTLWAKPPYNKRESVIVMVSVSLSRFSTCFAYRGLLYLAIPNSVSKYNVGCAFNRIHLYVLCFCPTYRLSSFISCCIPLVAFANLWVFPVSFLVVCSVPLGIRQSVGPYKCFPALFTSIVSRIKLRYFLFLFTPIAYLHDAPFSIERASYHKGMFRNIPLKRNVRIEAAVIRLLCWRLLRRSMLRRTLALLAVLPLANQVDSANPQLKIRFALMLAC